MDAGGIGPPPSRCKREGLPLAYASAQSNELKNFRAFKFLVYIIISLKSYIEIILLRLIKSSYSSKIILLLIISDLIEIIT